MTLHGNISINRGVLNGKSSMLWHRRLDHIFIEQIKRLVKDGIKTLDFTDFDICVDCITRKNTNKTKKSANRSFDILEVIHTDIYGHFHKCAQMARNVLSLSLMIIHYICIYTLFMIKVKH